MIKPKFDIENNIDLIFLIACILLFIVLYVFLMLVYRDKPDTKAKIHKRNIFNTYDIKTIIFMVVAAGAGTLILSQISFSIYTNVSIFVCILLMLPSVINSEVRRIIKENTLDDVILYCSSTSMLLKNTHNVFNSIDSVRKDLKTSLSVDLEQLLIAMQEGKEQTLYVMKKIEESYPYTCINNLNIIISFMFFENKNIENSIIVSYQNDLERLSKFVNENKAKRKGERMLYISLNIIAVVGYWYFLDQMNMSFDTNLGSMFTLANSLFIFAILISLFFVNTYFTSTSTKE